MSDPYARGRQTVVCGTRPVKIFASELGAMYAARRLAVRLWAEALREVTDSSGDELVEGDPRATGLNLKACVFRHSNFDEWIVGEPKLEVPAGWWLSTVIYAPQIPHSLMASLVESGEVVLHGDAEATVLSFGLQPSRWHGRAAEIQEARDRLEEALRTTSVPVP